jgi:hypothetical protein
MTIFAALGFLPTGPAAGSAAASIMTWLGGQSGIAAGSAYAIAQSASMGGTATGIIATVGGMTVGGLVVSVAVPVVVIGGSVYAVHKYSIGKEDDDKGGDVEGEEGSEKEVNSSSN